MSDNLKIRPEEFIRNFRDVGFCVNCLVETEPLPEAVIYRGGSLNSIFHHHEILNIPTIINLRTGKDAEAFDCKYHHFPASNTLENYETTHKTIRKWLNDVLSCITNEKTELPVFIHCTAGKDRTGVVVAAILKGCGIPDNIITAEYLLSEGKVKEEFIRTALAGFGDIDEYLEEMGGVQELRRKLGIIE
ncbi:MAG: tyrosine-protein phosphatase [bacterium]|nr:tyrosine-protein phosphatase [bacterium]